MITRPLVGLIGILSNCRIGEHHRSVANSEQPINDRIEANELNELSEHFVSNPTGTRRKPGFPRKLSRNPILIVESGDFSEGTFSVKPDKVPIVDPTMPSEPDKTVYCKGLFAFLNSISKFSGATGS
jgi:hypothetical protein